MDFWMAFTYHRVAGPPEIISPEDRRKLRELARRAAEIAHLPVMAERRRLWKEHNALKATRPLVLVFPEGAWEELLPDSAFECEGKRARDFEANLRSRIYHHEHLHDDMVIEGDWNVSKAVRQSWWGLTPKFHQSDEARGAYSFEQVLETPADLAKIKFPEVTHDEDETRRTLAEAQDLFGDILNVKLRGVCSIMFAPMAHLAMLRGLGQVMLDMYESPGLIHDAMAIFEEGYRRQVRQYVDLDLLGLNNDATYHSSGGLGYTDELPQPDFNPERVRPCDMWAGAEAQEMAQVSPEMHNEFVLQYEKRLLEPFGLNGYGCCEDLTRKLDDVFTIPNIRRISICPWADVDRCAERLQDDYIFSWKPNPAHLVGTFDGDAMRDYIGHTLAAARGCVLEIILKDTHTCEHHPERFTRWTDIARELIEGVRD